MIKAFFPIVPKDYKEYSIKLVIPISIAKNSYFKDILKTYNEHHEPDQIQNDLLGSCFLYDIEHLYNTGGHNLIAKCFLNNNSNFVILTRPSKIKTA